METVTIIGIDIAKNVFHLHGAAADGEVIFRKKLTRAKLLNFVGKQPPCLVVMEACGGAHHWGREIIRMGHDVRLISPHYVKPFVKRQKNDANDAEAIVEAASRKTMRFVAVKTADQQSQAVVLKTRDLLQMQRTQAINALRGHLTEYGIVAPQGPAHISKLEAALQDSKHAIPDVAVELSGKFLDHIHALTLQISELTKQISTMAKTGEVTRRLMSIPGVGPIGAVALATLAPPYKTFDKGRDFSAWVGLTPKQHSTGGKTRLGRTSKMGQRDIRRLLIIGAMAVIQAVERRGLSENTWLSRMLARKPKMLVAVALANKIARTAWSLMARGGVYRSPLTA